MALRKPIGPVPTQVYLERTPLPLWAWLAILGGAAVLFAVWAFTPARTDVPDVPAEALYAGIYDLEAMTALRAPEPEVGDAELVVLGSSRDVAALWIEPKIRKAVGEAAGRDVSVVLLLAYNVSPVDYLYLAEQMHPTRRVLLGVTPQSFAWPQELPLHLTRGSYVRPIGGFIEAHNEELPWLAENGPHPLSLRFTYERGMLYRLTRHRLSTWFAATVYRQPPRVLNPLGRSPAGDLERQQKHRDRWLTGRMQIYDENKEANTRVLAMVIERLKAKGAEVRLFVAPVMDQDIDGAYEPWWADYEARVASLGREHGAKVVDFNDRIQLGPEDFVDSIHLGKQGRDRWSKLFVETATTWVGEGTARP